MDLSSRRKLAIMAYIVYIALFYIILAFDIEPFASYTSTFGLIGNLMAFPMYRTGLEIHRGQRCWPWIWFTATAVFYFIGDLIWAYSADFLGAEPVPPSLADLFYLLNSYTCCCAFICYMQQMKRLDVSSGILDILVSTAAVADIMYRFIISPLLSDDSVGIFEMFSHANMSVIDMALLAGTLMIIFGTSEERFYTERTLLLATGFFACCFVEQLSLAIDVYELPLSSVIEPLWALPFWLFALTAMYPDEDSTDEESVRALHRRWGKLLKYSCVLFPYIITTAMFFLIGPYAALRDPVFLMVILIVADRTRRRVMAFSRSRGVAAANFH